MTAARSDRLPRISPEAEFVPFHEVRGRPNVVVDGPQSEGTVLGLSHWPSGGTPPELAADTSTEIVARYLDAAPDGPEVRVVTNNHFDEDGLLAAWLLLERVGPGPRRDAAIAAAEAGDFRTWREPAAAWSAIALMAMAERATTPFPDVLRALNRTGGLDPAGELCRALLPRVEGLLDDPVRYARLWRPRWDRVTADLALVDAADATIQEVDGSDLAIVRAERQLDGFAVLPRVRAMRVLHATREGLLLLEHRYETWVRYTSRRLPPRVDLGPLVPRLDAIESRPGAWRFEGVFHPLARLHFTDATGSPAPSGIAPEVLANEVAEYSQKAKSSR